MSLSIWWMNKLRIYYAKLKIIKIYKKNIKKNQLLINILL